MILLQNSFQSLKKTHFKLELRCKTRNVFGKRKFDWKGMKMEIYLWGGWRRSGVFIINFEQISHIVLVFLLLTLNNLNAGWERSELIDP